MSLANTKTAKNYTKTFAQYHAEKRAVQKQHMILFFRAFLFSFFYFAQVTVHASDWVIDLSRRQTDFNRIQNTRMPAATNLPAEAQQQSDSEILQALKKVVNPVEVAQEIVILQNEEGFVPSQVNLKKGEVYKIHVVNLNSKEKNVSFLMDAFSQSHNTVFGVMKTFTIQPKVEGVFSYQSPETGMSGKLVVVPSASEKGKQTVRKMASEE